MCWKKQLLKTHLGQIRVQLRQLLKDKELLQLQFQILLKHNHCIYGTAKELKLEYNMSPFEITDHPSLFS